MPITYRIDRDIRLIHTRAWGALTFVDMLANRLHMVEDPEFEPGLNQLADFSDVTELYLTGDQIREFAATYSDFSAGSRRALVVPRPAHYGLARMFEAYRRIKGGQEEIRSFRSVEAARAWLGLPVPSVRAATNAG